MLLATFSSLRWGELAALRRSDLDLEAGPVRVRAALVERSTGEILLRPPKSKAGRLVVGVPEAIIPVLREHLSVFVANELGVLLFPGAKGGPLRWGNFKQDVRLVARGEVDRRRGPVLPRSSPNGQYVRSGQRCEAAGSHGPGWDTTASGQR